MAEMTSDVRRTDGGHKKADVFGEDTEQIGKNTITLTEPSDAFEGTAYGNVMAAVSLTEDGC